ncbi:MAG: hypothetical protein ACFFCE_14975 [Promethearchaeota archaeon]
MNSDEISQVNVAAYYLAQKGYTYDKLCWMLAERELFVQRDPNYNIESRIREKAAEIFFSGPTYDILCYLISEIDIKMKSRKNE